MFSTIGAANSLRGGMLIMTRLRGVDGEVYAIAQGAMTSTGVEVNGAGDENHDWCADVWANSKRSQC